MPVELTIVETTLELGQTNVEVILESASEPGPAGPGVPAGGTINQVLTKDSATDFDTSWQDAQGGGGGAPDDADYLVGTAHGDLTAEIVVGTTPGGELGGTWAAPTVDATHSGSSHAAVQAAAEATAAAALSAHEADTTGVHGIADTSALALTANHPSNATFNDHSARHEDGGADEISLTGLSGTPAALTTHEADTTSVHGIADTSALALTANHPTNATFNDHSARHEDGGADEISIQGLAGTPLELTNHLSDAADAHDASAISVLDSGANYTATDVEGVLAEIAPQLGAGGGVPDLQYESRSTNTILGVADKGKVIDITATITQTFEADETLGDGWWVILRNTTDDGTTILTLDPAGAETIDGIANPVMYSGEARMILCNGAGGNFNSVMLSGGYVLFTSSGSFKIPSGCTLVKANPIGGGGGGGGGRGGNAGTVRQGGGAGGGGAGPIFDLPAELLGAAGDTVTVTIGTGGAGGGGGSAANGSAGSGGINSSFGVFVGYGGGGGGGGTNTATSGVSGGGGGGIGAAGGVGANNVDSTGGSATAAGLAGVHFEGAGNDKDSPAFATGQPANYGGAAGGGAPGDGAGTARTGGCSLHGGGGGGGGAGLPTGNNENAGGPAGGTGLYATSGIGGAGGAVNGGAGDPGADFGDGGGGGGSQASGTGGAGGAGAVGGGGGGGGGGGTTVGGDGGDGGGGACRVWYS